MALASLLLNALSFIFTMRFSRAVGTIAVWALFFWLVLPRSEHWPEAAQVIAYGSFMLGPMIINAVLLIRHQIDLDRPPLQPA